MEGGGDSGWIEQTGDGHLKKERKKEGCLSDSFCPESSSLGRAISYFWRAFFRGCVMQGRKTAKGSKNRIEHRSHHHHFFAVAGFAGRAQRWEPRPGPAFLLKEKGARKLTLHCKNIPMEIHGVYNGDYAVSTHG